MNDQNDPGLFFSTCPGLAEMHSPASRLIPEVWIARLQ